MFTQHKEIDKLEQIRETICIQMIEATGNKLRKLETRLEKIEEKLELKKMELDDMLTIRKLTDEFK